MNIKEIIETVNKIQNLIENMLADNIGDEIQKTIDKCKSGNDKKNMHAVANKVDLKGFKTVGFYMVFNTDNNKNNMCQLKIQYKNKEYYCVYRGQSYHMHDRLISHLFYQPNGPYPNCMKVEVNGKKYNINLEEKALYEKNVKVVNANYPSWEWLVIKISLQKTKQATREMFEDAFDKKFGRPIYSFR